MNNGDKPIANPFVVLREEFDDWAVLFDPATGHGFGLNPTAVYLWKLLNGEHALDALIEKLHGHADNPPEDLRDHIGAFVDAVVAQGLAGFNSNEFGLLENADRQALNREKCSHAPPEAVGEVKPCTYEPPQLVNLNSKEAAHGDCTTGSGASGCSTNGILADTCCNSGGSGTPGTLQLQCCTGFCPLWGATNNCVSGNVPSNCCYDGTTPHVSS